MIDWIYIILLLVAVFLVFLMLSSGRRRHELMAAMTKLQTQKLQLKKNLEHVKLAEKQGKISEREALTHRSHFETELAEVERKIIELKEKPLGRTLKKQQEDEQAEEMREEAKEAMEAQAAEGVLMSKLDAKFVVVVFAIIVFVIAYAMLNADNVDFLSPTGGLVSVSLEANAVPEGGTCPGGSAGVRVYLTNTHSEAIEDVIITLQVPDDSMLRFESGHVAYKRISEIGAGGERDIFIPLSVDKEAIDGEYIITVRVTTADGNLDKSTTTKLPVSKGSINELEDY